jgi:hypothetical protein
MCKINKPGHTRCVKMIFCPELITCAAFGVSFLYIHAAFTLINIGFAKSQVNEMCLCLTTTVGSVFKIRAIRGRKQKHIRGRAR